MTTRRPEHLPALLVAVPMIGLLVLPLAALVAATSPGDLAAGFSDPLVGPALWLSARTSLLALAVIVAFGTPLAWWLSVAPAGARKVVEVVVDLPIVVPPAVMGIALLQTFGRSGLFGPWLDAIDLQVPFTTAAVVLAQVVVAAPFYIQSAAAAFRGVDRDLLIVARTLGQSPAGAFRRIAIPLALPGLVAGGALAWARALGEFGATLLFAGNLPGTTQTMPLAIYTALESDVRVAVALSIALAGAGGVLLFALRVVPSLWGWRTIGAALGSNGVSAPGRGAR